MMALGRALGCVRVTSAALALCCVASASRGSGVDELDARLRALEQRLEAAQDVLPKVAVIAPAAPAEDAFVCSVESADAPERRKRLAAVFARVDRDLGRANKRAVDLRRAILSEGCDERRRSEIAVVRREIESVDPEPAAQEGDVLLDCVNQRIETTAAAIKAAEDQGNANFTTVGLSQRMNALTTEREDVLDLSIDASSAVEFRKRVGASLDTLKEICDAKLDF